MVAYCWFLQGNGRDIISILSPQTQSSFQNSTKLNKATQSSTWSLLCGNIDFSHALEFSLAIYILLIKAAFFFQGKNPLLLNHYSLWYTKLFKRWYSFLWGSELDLRSDSPSITSCVNMGQKRNLIWSFLVNKMGIIMPTWQHCWEGWIKWDNVYK